MLKFDLRFKERCVLNIRLTFTIALDDASSQQWGFATSWAYSHSSIGRRCPARQYASPITSAFHFIVGIIVNTTSIIIFLGVVRIVAVVGWCRRRSVLFGDRRQQRIASIPFAGFDRGILVIVIHSCSSSTIPMLSPFLQHGPPIDNSAIYGSNPIAATSGRVIGTRQDTFSPKGFSPGDRRGTARGVGFLGSSLVLVVASCCRSNIVPGGSIENASSKSSASQGHAAAARTHRGCYGMIVPDVCLRPTLFFTRSFNLHNTTQKIQYFDRAIGALLVLRQFPLVVE